MLPSGKKESSNSPPAWWSNALKHWCLMMFCGTTRERAPFPLSSLGYSGGMEDSLLLDLVTFHHSHHAFCEAVIAFGIIVLVEVEAKDKGESLPDVCSHRTDESFGDLVSRLIAFSVDKFHQ